MPDQPDIIERLTESAFDAFALLAGCELGVFTALAEGAATADALAARLDVNADKLAPLLYALVVAGLIAESDGRFSNGEEAARFLNRLSPDFVGARHLIWADLWEAALGTAETVRTGLPQSEHDFTAMSEVEQSAYFGGLHPRALRTGRAFANAVDLSRYRSLLDVGCGSGGFACGIADVSTDLDVSATDLPAVIPIAKRFIAESGCADRVRLFPTDVLSGPPSGHYDAIILKNFLQVFSEADARTVLRNVRDSVAAGGHLYVLGDILEDDRTAPADSVRINLGLINLYRGGQAYTFGQYAAWLAEAGYGDLTRIDEETIRAERAG